MDNIEALAARLMIHAVESGQQLAYADAYDVALSAMVGVDVPVQEGWTHTPNDVLNVRDYPGTERDGGAVRVAAKLGHHTPVRVWQRRTDGWDAITFATDGGVVGGGWVAGRFVL